MRQSYIPIFQINTAGHTGKCDLQYTSFTNITFYFRFSYSRICYLLFIGCTIPHYMCIFDFDPVLGVAKLH